MDKVLTIKETTLTNIGNAIREKEQSSGLIPVEDMPDRIRAIHGGGEGGLKPYRPIYSPVYIDSNGKFKRPEEWDDIESVDCPFENAYFLYQVKGLSMSWCSFNVQTKGVGDYVFEFGRIKDGRFISFGQEYDLVNSNYKNLTEAFPDQDYVVIHFYTTEDRVVTQLAFYARTISGISLATESQPCRMRYVNLPNATQVTTSGMRLLVSDKVINAQSLTSCASMYNNCLSLVRVVRENWNTSRVTTFSSMFANTPRLTDIDWDLSGLVYSTCTNISAMFQSSIGASGEINVSGWDTSNVASIKNFAQAAYNITKFIGIEDWDLRKCSAYLSTFQNCSSLQGELNLSNWHLSQDVTSFSASDSIYTNLFSGCSQLTKIDISGWDMSYAPKIGTMFSTCYQLREVKLPNNVGASTPFAGPGSMFSDCYNLRKVSGKLNMVATPGVSGVFQNCYCLMDLSELIFDGEILGQSTKPTTITFLSNAPIKILDLSWLDASKISYRDSATSSGISSLLTNLFELVDFIPPRKIATAFSLASCPSLSHESIIRVLNSLSTVTQPTTLTLARNILVSLSNEEIAIATQKGWTVA